MGKQKWFRSKSFYVVLLCASAAITAVASVIAQYVNNHKPKRKGGPTKHKKRVPKSVK